MFAATAKLTNDRLKELAEDTYVVMRDDLEKLANQLSMGFAGNVAWFIEVAKLLMGRRDLGGAEGGPESSSDAQSCGRSSAGD
jgi:hypothetical protein